MKARERDYYLRQEGKIEGLQVLSNMVINKLRKNIPYTEIASHLTVRILQRRLRNSFQ